LVDLEHLDPLEFESQWDGAYQHLLSQADDLLELGSLMRDENELAERSVWQSRNDESTTVRENETADIDAYLDEPRLLKMSEARGGR
jgi:hypothetical protein